MSVARVYVYRGPYLYVARGADVDAVCDRVDAWAAERGCRVEWYLEMGLGAVEGMEDVYVMITCA